jgi:hypothetical protein
VLFVNIAYKKGKINNWIGYSLQKRARAKYLLFKKSVKIIVLLINHFHSNSKGSGNNG